MRRFHRHYRWAAIASVSVPQPTSRTVSPALRRARSIIFSLMGPRGRASRPARENHKNVATLGWRQRNHGEAVNNPPQVLSLRCLHRGYLEGRVCPPCWHRPSDVHQCENGVSLHKQASTGLRHRPLKTKHIGLTSSDLSEEPGEAFVRPWYRFIRTGRPEVALNARGVSEPRLGQSQDRYTLPVEFSRSTEMTTVP
jgi:hypothetical protein